MAEVWMDMDTLMELLDKYENSKLYPRIKEDDEVIKVQIFGAGQVCFEIGKPRREEA